VTSFTDAGDPGGGAVDDSAFFQPNSLMIYLGWRLRRKKA